MAAAVLPGLAPHSTAHQSVAEEGFVPVPQGSSLMVQAVGREAFPPSFPPSPALLASASPASELPGRACPLPRGLQAGH